MIEITPDITVDSLIIGGLAFVVSFFILLVLWSAFLRTLTSVFGRSKFFFIPRTLKELFFSIAFVFILISLAVAIALSNKEIFTGELLKIWEILLIFSIANIFVRIVLTGIDAQSKKAKDNSGIYRSIGLLKSTAGIVLYLIAIIISINVLSSELGATVTLIGLFIVLLIFASSFDQIKSIVAGLQLGDYYIDVGNRIKMDNKSGFIESVHGRSTIIKTMEGSNLIIPNHEFFNKKFEIENGDVVKLFFSAEIEGRDSNKIKKRLCALASKVAMETRGMPTEYQPKISHFGIKNKKQLFMITYMVMMESDIMGLFDRLSKELSSEFKNRIENLKLEN